MSRRAPSPEQKAAAQAKRAALAAQCFPLHLARKAGAEPWASFETINDCLLHIYTAETQQAEWNTFKGWRDKGQPVKKGEKGFPIWGRPLGAKSADPDPEEMQAAEGEGEPCGNVKFFPLAYLFHAGQVETV